ncbi:hypothetical protein [Caulobacter sp. Root1472]|jgi:hypothetical protein|uniref:hypothetical protein n=1 Tax=Caulobacter sp. Root1472 TaxID=1736470 RepID=UPI0006F4E100|nr:hypothetical protein [Caulobacter sp. Root1472]KQZ33203.1 hypothetical protein ASD47_13560 [Caulobacter sp. Root1472]
MIRITASVALAVSLVAAPSAMATDKPQPMGWLAQTLRSAVVFHSCTERLKEKFNIGPLDGIDITHMDSDGDPAGVMDVKFEAVTIEKKTQRKSRFVGVCHVGREGETRIDARLISQNGGAVRRVPPGRIAG